MDLKLKIIFVCLPSITSAQMNAYEVGSKKEKFLSYRVRKTFALDRKLTVKNFNVVSNSRAVD